MPQFRGLLNELNAVSARTVQVRADQSRRDHERRYSLRASLLGLVALCILPSGLICAALAYSHYVLQKQRIQSATELTAQQLAATLDQELAAVFSGMRMLASAPELASGDLAAFHRRALAGLEGQIVNNYLLTNRSEQQALNTMVPWGQPLPQRGTPAQLRAVFESGASVVTDLFIGPVTRQPVIAMGVPVYQGQAVVYSLNIGLSPDRIARVLARRSLPEGWVAAVLDGSGTIVARSRDAQRYVGQPAVPDLVAAVQRSREGLIETTTKDGIDVVTAYSRSSLSAWSVAVGAPKSLLEQQLYGLIASVAAALTIALGLGLWLARRLAGRVTQAVRGLNDAAIALGQGVAVQLPTTRLVEADAVGVALVQAGLIFQHARHLAQHDSLTDLANRTLFNERLIERLSARADGEFGATSLAVLALDLDGFKAVNDRHGHATGDRLLKAIAGRIVSALRASDIAARLGGDEFVVLLTQTDAQNATLTAQRLVDIVCAPHPDGVPACTVSIGLVLGQDGVAPDQASAEAAHLMARADHALYAAKRAGKCQVVVAEPAAR